VIYACAKAICRAALRLFYRWRVEGADRVPSKGPVILCCNHVSWLDPINLGCAVGPRVYFMAKEELFRIPVFGGLLRALGAFPVARGKADRRAIRRALELLEEGKVLGLFPEGTRSRTGRLGKAQPGAAMIALKSGTPIVPVVVTGSYRPFGKLGIKVGDPIHLPGDGRHDRESARKAAGDRIMEAIAALGEGGRVRIGGGQAADTG